MNELLLIKKIMIDSINQNFTFEKVYDEITTKFSEAPDKESLQKVWSSILSDPINSELIILRALNEDLVKKNNLLQNSSIVSNSISHNFPSELYNDCLNQFPENKYNHVLSIIKKHINFEEIDALIEKDIVLYKENQPNSQPKAILIYDATENPSFPAIRINIVSDNSLKNAVKDIGKMLTQFKSAPGDQFADSIYRFESITHLINKHNFPPSRCAVGYSDLYEPNITGNHWNDFLWSLSIYTAKFLKEKENINYPLTVRCCHHDELDDFCYLKV